MVGAIQVDPGDEGVLISPLGTLVRTPVEGISEQGRNTQGVRLIRLDDGDRLVGLDRIIALSDSSNTVIRTAFGCSTVALISEMACAGTTQNHRGNPCQQKQLRQARWVNI